MGMTPSFGHPTNPPALRKYWCSEVVDFIFIVQKTTRNVQKSNSTTILQSYQTISRFWAESLDLPQMPADQLAKKLPPEKRHSSLCATESISVEVGNAKDLWKISFVFFGSCCFFWGWWGGNLLSNVKQIVFGTQRPGTSTRSRPVKAPGPCNIRSPILPTGHTSQGVTWLQGNHSGTIYGWANGCKR